MNDHDQSSGPETVLNAVTRITGDKPKVFLRDSDSDQGGSPVVKPKSPDAALLPKGRGNYQILGEIARGGMGVVLKGHDTDLGRDIALKMLDQRLIGNAEVLQRFVEEAQIGGQLQHPGIVPVYELGMMDDERPYFTMKLVKGRTLTALLDLRKHVEEDRRRFLSIFESVCQTVAYAHSKGVIHRDLKPANIMVGAFGEVQVVDWGLAKVLGSGGVADEMRARRSEFTIIETVRSGPGSGGSDSVVGSVMGTPAYMAPEQAMGDLDKVDERADVFALGAILCEILTGKPPYVGTEKERTVVMAAHARLEPARERLTACEADPELKRLCEECLSTAPTVRPRNAEEVARRIHEHLEALEERTHQAELDAREARVKAEETGRRQRLTLLLAGTIVVAIVAIGAIIRNVEQQREADRIQQLASTQQALDDAATQVVGLQDEGRYDEALEVARATLSVIESGDVQDAAMADRANNMVALAEERVAEADQRKDVERKNVELLARCEELRMKQIEANFGFSPRDLRDQLEAGYVAAFRDYGIDLADEDLPAALDVLSDSGIGAAAALALDDWASVRRQLFGWDSFEVESVSALAFDLDPDPLRTRMREVLLTNDKQALLELARTEDLSAMGPSTLWVLSQGLAAFSFDDEVFQVVREGVRRHPEDFLLNFRMGELLINAYQHEVSIQFLTVARSLRPENGAVRSVLGDAFNDIGNDPAAYEAYAAALRLNPELIRVYRYIGWYAFFSGKLEEAVRAYDKVQELYPADTQWEFEGNLARSFAGRMPMSRVVARIRPGQLSFEAGFSAWALVYHPDPDQRDPALALEYIMPLVEADFWGIGGKLIAAASNLRLGRPEEAERLLASAEDIGGDWNRSFRSSHALLNAWAQHEQGNRELAERYFSLAEDTFFEFLYDGWEPWRGSVEERLYHEIEALVRG